LLGVVVVLGLAFLLGSAAAGRRGRTRRWVDRYVRMVAQPEEPPAVDTFDRDVERPVAVRLDGRPDPGRQDIEEVAR